MKLGLRSIPLVLAAIFMGTAGLLAADTGSRTFTEPCILPLEPKTEMNVVWLTSESAREAFEEHRPTDALDTRTKTLQYEIKGLKTAYFFRVNTISARQSRAFRPAGAHGKNPLEGRIEMGPGPSTRSSSGLSTPRPICEKYGMCAVSYGHSHVYERYGVSGFGSFMLLHCDLASGPSAKSVRASVEAGNDGYPGRLFDEFTVEK